MRTVENDLWCEVLAKAWSDFIAPKPDHPTNASLWASYRREAFRFLTMKSGPWARSRADICNAVGIDPDALRERALQWEKENE